MRLYLANDTSTEAHAGCKAVMRSLRAALSQVPNLTITATHQVGSMDVDEAAFDAADAVLINGEGSIHHSTARATFPLVNLAPLTGREARAAACARRFAGKQGRLPLQRAAEIAVRRACRQTADHDAGSKRLLIGLIFVGLACLFRSAPGAMLAQALS